MKACISGHVNLIWSPVKQVNTGIEYMILRRTNNIDNFGVGNRLQAMVSSCFKMGIKMMLTLKIIRYGNFFMKNYFLN